MNEASWLERTWTMIAIVGLAFSLWAIWDDWLDLRAVRLAIRLHRAVTWGPRWWVAAGFLGSDGLFCLAWLGFASIGVLAMTLPPSPVPQREKVSEISGWVLVAMEIALALIEVWWRVVRVRVRELIPGITPTSEQAGQS